MASRLKKGAALAVMCVGLVGGFEGLRTVAYRDPVGIPTVCFGETRGVHMGDHYTAAQCKDMLKDALIRTYEPAMRRCMANPDAVPDPSYAAFLSFSYNVGSGAFCHSSLLAKLNRGDLRGACDGLLAWNKAGGFVLPGLERRRRAERALCLKGVK